MLQERYKVLSLLVIALAITGSLAVMWMVSPTKADTTTTATKTLTVSGSGLATGAPDTYTVSLAVVGVDASSSAAMQKANGVYNSLVSALEKGGYNTTLLTLSSLNVYPEYYYPSNGPAVFQDYRVVYSLQYVETVANPTPSSLGTRAAGVISAAVQAGVNNIYGVSFSLSNAAGATLKSEALVLAAADAKGKATSLAQSLGVQILGVQSAQAADSYTPPIYSYATDTKGGVSTPAFNAGPATETAQITVVYIIG
jgi:uncharacterized protein YggE